MSDTPRSRLLSVPEAAERLGVDVRTLRQMIGLGHFPSEWVGSRSKVPAAAVDEFLRFEVIGRAAGYGVAYALRFFAAAQAEGWTLMPPGGGR
jgi:excisionase family DNA binding protein